VAFWRRGFGGSGDDDRSARPPLKQVGALVPADFDRHPVWFFVHALDYGEPWHDETDEDTVRPWTGDLPLRPGDATFVAGATFQLADGTALPGFVILSGDAPQPTVFAPSGEPVAFWWGAFPPDPEQKAAAYAALDRGPESVFPARWTLPAGTVAGVSKGIVEGFASIPDFDEVRVER
jgi:hypothetical protein